MSLVKYILPSVALAVLAVSLRSEEDNTPVNSDDTTTTPQGGQGLTMGQLRELVDQQDKERLNYRRLWAIAWHDLLYKYGASDALQMLWDAWNTKENVFFSLFPSKEALLMIVATYIPNRGEDLLEDKEVIEIGQPTIIRWDSTPIYEDLYCIFSCSNDYWTCADWEAWHKALDAKFGTYKANDIWLAAWQAPENQCLLLASMGCPDTDFCRVNCDFVEYFYSKGITIGNVLSNVYCDLSNVVMDITQVTSNVTGAAGNLSDGIQQTSSVLGNLLPLGALIVGGYFVYNYATTEKK